MREGTIGSYTKGIEWSNEIPLKPKNPCLPAGRLESLSPIKDFKNIFRTKEVNHGTED